MWCDTPAVNLNHHVTGGSTVHTINIEIRATRAVSPEIPSRVFVISLQRDGVQVTLALGKRTISSTLTDVVTWVWCGVCALTCHTSILAFCMGVLQSALSTYPCTNSWCAERLQHGWEEPLNFITLRMRRSQPNGFHGFGENSSYVRRLASGWCCTHVWCVWHVCVCVCLCVRACSCRHSVLCVILRVCVCVCVCVCRICVCVFSHSGS